MKERVNWLTIFLGLVVATLVVILITRDNISANLSNLLSGLLGSLIGAGAVVWSASQQMKAVSEQSRQERKEDEEAAFVAALTALREEARLNSFPEPPVNEVLAAFMTRAWESFGPYLGRLDRDLVTLLTKGYSKAQSHRVAVSMERSGSQNPYGGTAKMLYGQAVECFKFLKDRL